MNVGKKIVGISVEQHEVLPGDRARRRNSQLDPRTVSRISHNSLYLDLAGTEMGPFRADRYEFTRLYLVDEADGAIGVPCIVCNAKQGEQCTAPTDTGRRQVPWFHHSREDVLR